MNLKFPKKEKDVLDELIERQIAQMQLMNKGTKEYVQAAESLKKLYEAKATNAKQKISADALLAAGVNILVVLAIITFEAKGHIITTKATSFFKGFRG